MRQPRNGENDSSAFGVNYKRVTPKRSRASRNHFYRRQRVIEIAGESLRALFIEARRRLMAVTERSIQGLVFNLPFRGEGAVVLRRLAGNFNSGSSQRGHKAGLKGKLRLAADGRAVCGLGQSTPYAELHAHGGFRAAIHVAPPTRTGGMLSFFTDARTISGSFCPAVHSSLLMHAISYARASGTSR